MAWIEPIQGLADAWVALLRIACRSRSASRVGHHGYVLPLWLRVAWVGSSVGLGWLDLRFWAGLRRRAWQIFRVLVDAALLGLHSDAGWEILLGRFVWDAYGPFIQYKNRIRPRKYWASTWAEFGPAMGQPGPMMIMLWILSSGVPCPNQNTQN